MATSITNFRNAKSLNAENTRFDVEIEHPDHGWIPYTLDPDDTDETIKNEELTTLIGSTFEAYVAPTQEELNTAAAHSIRAERDYKLVSEVDPLATNSFRWAELTSEKQTEWTQYRRNLLDVPEQSSFPTSVTWPTKPS
jgi:hypothetical protein